jgi:hypothetical protein
VAGIIEAVSSAISTLLALDAQCRWCGYLLSGLPEARCPECGDRFDPSDPETYLTGTWGSRAVSKGVFRTREIWVWIRRPLIWAFRVGACAWVSWVLFTVAQGGFSILYWTPVVYLLYRRMWMGTVVFLLLTPRSIYTIERCRDYAAGSHLYVRGEYDAIQTPQGSANPVTRVRGYDPGCGTRSPNSWLTRGAQRRAISIMHALIGPPPGAYRGEYPTKEECLRALRESGQDQKQRFLEQGLVRLGPRSLLVLPEQFLRWDFVVRQPDPGPARAALFGQQCLIVRVPREASAPKLAVIHLFDVTTGRPFAVYYDSEADAQ